MWKDLAMLLMFCLMILMPCIMATNAGQWGTEEDGGYERGTPPALPGFRRKKNVAAAVH